MKVNLIQKTDNPLEVVWTACKTCYSEKGSFELYESSNEPQPNDIDNMEYINKKQKLVQKVLDSGHMSVARHVYFTFCLDGISRACANQLERHTAGFAYSQQSMRYVKFNFKTEDIKTKQDAYDLVKKYYYIDRIKEFKDSQLSALYNSLNTYQTLTEEGVNPEDARGILGLNFKTNVIMSCNLQAFIHLCNLRLCTHSQSEIRQMVSLMRQEILNNDNYKFLAKYLVSNCKNCTDFRGCNNKVNEVK